MRETFKIELHKSDVESAARKTVEKASKDPVLRDLDFNDFHRLSLMVMESLLEANEERKERGW